MDRLVNPRSRFLELVQNNPIRIFERRRILSGMTSGPIYSKDLKIPKEKTKKRRARRKVLPEPLPRLDGSDDSGINENCDVIHVEDEFHFGNSVFIRCPVIECDFKHLTNDKNDNSEILAHMKQNHLGKFCIALLPVQHHGAVLPAKTQKSGICDPETNKIPKFNCSM